MKFTSSPLLMFRQLLFLLIFAFCVTGLSLMAMSWLDIDSMTPVYGVAVLSLLSCIGYTWVFT